MSKPDDILLGGGHAAAIWRGHLGALAAASGVLLGGVTDGQTTTDAPNTLEFAGLTVTDLGAGVTLVASSWKVPVRCATVSAGTLATSFANGQVVDGITLATYDRVLVKNQAAPAENGIYVVNATGAPSRSLDCGLSALVLGAVVYVVAGTANAGGVFACSNLTAPVLDTDAITWVRVNSGGGGGGGTGTSGWFNVKDYGATGNGTTDDTAAINLAIAALIAAGKGVLYFPAGTYKTTAALTTLSVSCTVLGDGAATAYDGLTGISRITSNSTTASVFTVTADGCLFANFELSNVAAGAKTAGAGITATQSALARYENVSIVGFYVGIDIVNGGLWSMDNCYIRQPYLYGVKIRNVAAVDGGDWSMTGCYLTDGANSSTAAIRIESGGGGKIVNCKVNGDATIGFNYAIDLATTIQTSVLEITGSSFENVRSHIIHMTSSGTARWHSIDITGCQFSTQTTSGANAIFISAGTLADFKGLTITGCVFKAWNATTAASISLTKVDMAVISAVISDGYATTLTTSGCTNIIDATGGVALSVAITGTPTSGQVPIASSGSLAAWGTVAGGVTGLAAPAFTLGTTNVAGAATTAPATDATIAAFDATVPAAVGTAATGSVAKAARRDHVHNTGAGTPTTSAIGDAAATGSGPAASMTDHVHGREALSTATPLVESGSGAVGTGIKSSREDHVHPAAAGAGAYWEVLMADGVTGPPEPLEDEARDDWLYGTNGS